MAYIYQNGAWAAYNPKKYDVNTTTFTTYPFTIKSPTTPISATIYGNMQQTGTPTPTTPIQPSECGDLETTGEHTGQYKIPILNNSQATNIYLGEVQTVRQIKKLVLDGTENWAVGNYPKPNSYQFYIPKKVYFPDANSTIPSGASFCTHFINQDTSGGFTWGTNFNIYMLIDDLPEGATANDFKAYLSAQYSAGTPVTIWYPLETETTGIVNEPIRKIGDYADTVTTSIPVTINSDSVDVNTTLKPSAVAAPSLSWGIGGDYKYSSGAWE